MRTALSSPPLARTATRFTVRPGPGRDTTRGWSRSPRGEPRSGAGPASHAASRTKRGRLSATRALTNSLIQVKSALRPGADASDEGPVEPPCAGDGGPAGRRVGTGPVPGWEKGP